ncbi:2-aminoethylphosphonate ABC transporter substrate-binding protein [Nocardiopsis composta]|uniref:2-aminoethylphosphonate transport system substrate-binding protein n=1 Tax=Nocardiopsis composta TaxID=157465 RepID=A0A7W8QHY1_9ACTN|nr:2-aminoethylphosphonate ABC transporter substrate-binding protein [Nocardiopsis composta]MBB5430802.1 2-aminoethylphosphonate transport system substrate-binding protein [Nocardiopsis composta]
MPATDRIPRTAALGAAALALGVTAALTGCSAGTADDPDVVTVYSADGLRLESGDGFFDKVFADFEEETGIRVDYVEGGSGEVVQRLTRESANTQADVLVTLPPFIQQAQGRGLLAPYEPEGSEKVPEESKDPDGAWTAVVDNYLCFIYNTEELDEPPRTWDDLLAPEFEGRLQYSTPGVAGDGTAVLLKAVHDFGGLGPAMEYLGELQANNVGPSSSTGALAPKVDKGELLVANGDVQMNFANMESMPSQGIFFPAAEEGEPPSTLSLPYSAGVVQGAPHTANARAFLDHLLSEEVQAQVSEVGGGFPVRTDVEPDDANAERLTELMDGVEVFSPDWAEVDENFDAYVEAWKEATGG